MISFIYGFKPVNSNFTDRSVPCAKKSISREINSINRWWIVSSNSSFFVIKSFVSKDISTSLSSEITWWGLWEDDVNIKSVISEYEAINTNIKIKYVKQSKEDYRERLTNTLAKGTGPDIFRFHNTWVPMYKSEFDKVPASVYSIGDFSTTFYPVAVSDLTIGGSLVGIPLEYDGLSLYINEEIFEKAGQDLPNNLE